MPAPLSEQVSGRAPHMAPVKPWAVCRVGTVREAGEGPAEGGVTVPAVWSPGPGRAGRGQRPAAGRSRTATSGAPGR